jgi:thioredoxin reductase (NADPH)
MPDSDLKYDLIVIGAGPAGCTAALYGARAGLKTAMLSPTALAGMMADAPVVGNFPGQIRAVPGRQILSRLRKQALKAGAEHILDAVSGADFGGPTGLRVFGGGQDYAAAAVIIATGASARAEALPGEKEFRGRGVCYCAACDAPLFKGEDLLVVGESGEAAEEAVALSGVAKSVCLVTPRDELKLDWELRQVLEARENITVRAGLKLQEIVGESEVTGAGSRGEGSEMTRLPATGVFLYLKGAAPETGFLGGALAMDEKGHVVTDDVCQTSVPGVFAAGDVRRKSVRQMVVAAADGCTAALAAERHIRGRAQIRTDRGQGR